VTEVEVHSAIDAASPGHLVVLHWRDRSPRQDGAPVTGETVPMEPDRAHAVAGVYYRVRLEITSVVRVDKSSGEVI
jgi:hypothetical protein